MENLDILCKRVKPFLFDRPYVGPSESFLLNGFTAPARLRLARHIFPISLFNLPSPGSAHSVARTRLVHSDRTVWRFGKLRAVNKLNQVSGESGLISPRSVLPPSKSVETGRRKGGGPHLIELAGYSPLVTMSPWLYHGWGH